MGGDRIEYDHPSHSQGLSIQKLAKSVTIYSPTKSFIEDRPINWNLLQWIPGSVTLRNSGEQSICKLGTHHRNLLPNAFLQTLPEVSEV